MATARSYYAIVKSPVWLPGGTKQHQTCRFAFAQDAQNVAEAYSQGCKDVTIEIVPSKNYPELFPHCGTESQAIGGRCSCGKILTVADAKKYRPPEPELDPEANPKCEKCGEETFKDCQGSPRCESCDPPCPSCDDGGGPV